LTFSPDREIESLSTARFGIVGIVGISGLAVEKIIQDYQIFPAQLVPGAVLGALGVSLIENPVPGAHAL
jgi:hypothetical protein